MALVLDRRLATRRPPHSAPARRLHALWTATAVSSIGDGLVIVAFPLLATRLTSNPTAIAGVAAATRLPWLLLSLLGGVLVDRVDRRRLLVAVELSRMTILLLVAAAIITGGLGLPLLYVLAFVLGALDSVFATSVDAVVPDIVDDDDLDQTNGRLVAVQTAGEQFIGPAIGAALFAAATAAPFLLDAVSFAASAALLVRAVPRRASSVVAESVTRTGAIQDLVDGLRHFRDDKPLRLLAGTIGCFAFLQAMVLATLAPYATKVLGSSAHAFGLLISIAAVGNVVGGLSASRVGRRFSAPAVLVVAGLASAVSYLVAGTTSSFRVAAAALAVEAFAVAVANVASMTLRQRLVPRHLLGRVGGALRTCIFGVMPLGALAGGAVALAGLRYPMLIAGAAQVVVVAALARPILLTMSAHPAVSTATLPDNGDVVIELTAAANPRPSATASVGSRDNG